MKTAKLFWMKYFSATESDASVNEMTIECMSEFAKQEAFEFAKWCAENGWQGMTNGEIFYKEHELQTDMRNFDELWELYQESKTK